jgi:choline dehydrogenase-like flavoprotein
MHFLFLRQATYMRDALSAPHPVQILVRAHADRIIFDPKTKKAVGVLTSVLNETQQQHHLVKINAKVVVTACGSVHTPALLLRSGLKNPNIGKHLRLHPVSGLFAEFSDPMQCYLGPMMTKLVDKFADMDGQGYGIRIEMAPVHPGLAASSVPWSGGSDFKTLLARGAYTASMIVLTRDKDSGHVSMDAKSGQPRLHYSISPLDSAHMIRGLEIGARIFRAAGALRVGTTQQGVAPFVLGKHKAGSKEEDAEFDRFLQSIRAAGTQPFTAGLFSAHQMGSCRMGGSSSYSVFDSHGECWEASNLFVTDASAFPTASGVNPMITTQTLAYYVAHNFICPRLQMLCSGNGPVTSKNDSTARKTSNL